MLTSHLNISVGIILIEGCNYGRTKNESEKDTFRAHIAPSLCVPWEAEERTPRPYVGGS